MNDPLELGVSTERKVRLAVTFELALGAAGVLVAWAAGVDLSLLVWPLRLAEAVTAGLLAGVLLMPLLAFLLCSRWQPLSRLRELVGAFVTEWLTDTRWWHLLAISVAAGMGEEILFRGALQPIAIRYTTPLVGIAITSLLFGLVHAATKTYFLIATLVGVYLGVLAWKQDEILSAMIAHAFYDFVALMLLVRSQSRNGREEPNIPSEEG